MPTDDNKQSGWLGRTLRQFLPRRAAGDVIAANVEAGAQHVTVGKNIIQIGQLIIPLPFLIAVILLLFGGFGLLAFQLNQLKVSGDQRMPGAFNIAIAEFTERDSRGKVLRKSETGALLSGWVYQVLNSNRESYRAIRREDEATLAIWYDGLPLSEKGRMIGQIAGDTAEAREQAAAQVAAEIGADVIIYGDFDTQQGLVPEFYVVPRQRYAIQQIVGRYQLGLEPVRIDPDDRLLTRDRLTPRTTALFWLLIGLRYAANGDTSAALEVFDHAQTALARWPGGVPGQESLDFVKGQTALFAAGRETSGSNTFSQLVDTAAQSFDAAIERDSTFARAYLGRGSVAFRRAAALAPAERLASPQLDLAVAAYREAAQRAPGTVNATLVAHSATLGLGQVEGLRADAHILLAQAARQINDSPTTLREAAAAESLLTPTLDAVQQALTGFRQLDPPNLRLQGQALLSAAIAARQLGLAREWQSDPAGAITWQQHAQAFAEQCIALATQADADRDEILQRDIVQMTCQPLREDAIQTITRLKGGSA